LDRGCLFNNKANSLIDVENIQKKPSNEGRNEQNLTYIIWNLSEYDVQAYIKKGFIRYWRVRC